MERLAKEWTFETALTHDQRPSFALVYIAVTSVLRIDHWPMCISH
jgi:hypothetical protein